MCSFSFSFRANGKSKTARNISILSLGKDGNLSEAVVFKNVKLANLVQEIKKKWTSVSQLPDKQFH